MDPVSVVVGAVLAVVLAVLLHRMLNDRRTGDPNDLADDT